MEKIKSFEVDHRFIKEGIYISRIDHDITTYDLRTKIPNQPDLMDHSTMHSVEHLFATIVRNSFIKKNVIYFGPMGCQTGFYLLVKDANNQEVLNHIKDIFEKISVYDGEMPGYSEIECGNYISLSIDNAKALAKEYFAKIKDLTVENLIY